MNAGLKATLCVMIAGSLTLLVVLPNCRNTKSAEKDRNLLNLEMSWHCFTLFAGFLDGSKVTLVSGKRFRVWLQSFEPKTSPQPEAQRKLVEQLLNGNRTIEVSRNAVGLTIDDLMKRDRNHGTKATALLVFRPSLESGLGGVTTTGKPWYAEGGPR